MLFFTSDVHFAHENTLIVENRPFKTPKSFDKTIIKIWNKQATKKDTIYVIGDFVDCDDEYSISWMKSLKYVKKIKAKVILVLGNNEERAVKYFFDNNFEKFREHCLKIGFLDVVKNCIVDVKGISFFLTHKPIDCKADMLNLFGHVHRSGGTYRPYGFNMGCDLNHFELYSEDDIMGLLEFKDKYWKDDKNLSFNVENK